MIISTAIVKVLPLLIMTVEAVDTPSVVDDDARDGRHRRRCRRRARMANLESMSVQRFVSCFFRLQPLVIGSVSPSLIYSTSMLNYVVRIISCGANHPQREAHRWGEGGKDYTTITIQL